MLYMFKKIETNIVIEIVMLTIIATDLYVTIRRAEMFIKGFIEGLKNGKQE